MLEQITGLSAREMRHARVHRIDTETPSLISRGPLQTELLPQLRMLCDAAGLILAQPSGVAEADSDAHLHEVFVRGLLRLLGKDGWLDTGVEDGIGRVRQQLVLPASDEPALTNLWHSVRQRDPLKC